MIRNWRKKRLQRKQIAFINKLVACLYEQEEETWTSDSHNSYARGRWQKPEICSGIFMIDQYNRKYATKRHDFWNDTYDVQFPPTTIGKDVFELNDSSSTMREAQSRIASYLYSLATGERVGNNDESI